MTAASLTFRVCAPVVVIAVSGLATIAGRSEATWWIAWGNSKRRGRAIRKIHVKCKT